MAEPKASVIDIPKRPTVAVAMAKSLAIADRWVFDLYQKKMKATPARFISMVRGLLPDAVWEDRDQLEAFATKFDLQLGFVESTDALCSRLDAWMAHPVASIASRTREVGGLGQ